MSAQRDMPCASWGEGRNVEARMPELFVLAPCSVIDTRRRTLVRRQEEARDDRPVQTMHRTGQRPGDARRDLSGMQNEARHAGAGAQSPLQLHREHDLCGSMY